MLLGTKFFYSFARFIPIFWCHFCVYRSVHDDYERQVVFVYLFYWNECFFFLIQEARSFFKTISLIKMNICGQERYERGYRWGDDRSLFFLVIDEDDFMVASIPSQCATFRVHKSNVAAVCTLFPAANNLSIRSIGFSSRYLINFRIQHCSKENILLNLWRTLRSPVWLHFLSLSISVAQWFITPTIPFVAIAVICSQILILNIA